MSFRIMPFQYHFFIFPDDEIPIMECRSYRLNMTAEKTSYPYNAFLEKLRIDSIELEEKIYAEIVRQSDEPELADFNRFLYYYFVMLQGIDPKTNLTDLQFLAAHDIKPKVKFSFAVTGISSLTQRSRSANNPVLEYTETIVYDNNSTQEQVVKTAARSRTFTDSTTTTTSSSLEVYGEISTKFSSEVSIPFVSKVEVEVGVTAGIKHTGSTEISSTKSTENKIEFPSQDLKCAPRKRTELTLNFFSQTTTIIYTADLDLDPEKTYFGIYFINDEKVFTHEPFCLPLKSLALDGIPIDGEKLMISNDNGKYKLLNVPIEVKKKGNYGNAHTRELDLPY